MKDPPERAERILPNQEKEKEKGSKDRTHEQGNR